MTSVAATQYLPITGSAVLASNFLVVSVHDVAPSSWEVARQIVAELGRRGVRKTSLLVVPDYHHEGSIVKHASFLSWLRELELDGHEIVIHGYFHQRPRRSDESIHKRLMTRFYTQDEGEFYDLDFEEALKRISSARDAFVGAGLKPRGFIAPAWLLGPDAERAAREAGMEYTTRLNSVRDLRSREDFAAPSLVYSARNEWRRQTSLCWNAALAQMARHKWLLRVSIHPVDFSHRTIWKQTCRLIDKMLSQRTPATYQEWIAEWRLRRTSQS